MPLTKDPVGAACEDDRIGIGFTMLNGEEKVIVWVDKSARVLRDKIPGSTDQTAFEQSRAAIEAIAAANYDAGIVEPDGTTVVRRIDVEGRG